MNIGLFIVIPVVFWLFIVVLIIAVSKPRRRASQNMGSDSAGRKYPQTRAKHGRSDRKGFERPKMQEGLFDMKLGKSGANKQKQTIFSNTGYDDYSSLSRKKDYTGDYDKKYSKDSRYSRQSAARQYSHTYNGHEPWDKCIPKEKDPWDKDFYS